MAPISFAVCFAEGTRIATDRGEVPVEELAPGMSVQTLQGQHEVRWTGSRRIVCAEFPHPSDIMPVCIATNALAPGRPRCDVRLSPDHAILVDGRLIPVRCLINGASIRIDPVCEVTYWHVEIARHAVLLADGLPAESWLDTGNRDWFDDDARRSPLMQTNPRPDEAYALHGCLPWLDSGPRVESARRMLAARAAALGYRVDAELIVDVSDIGAFRAEVPPGVRYIRIASGSAFVGTDRRRLGALISNLAIGGAPVDAADSRLRGGFHAVERHGIHVVRWTDGAAVIDLGDSPDPSSIAFAVHALGRPAMSGTG